MLKLYVYSYIKQIVKWEEWKVLKWVIAMLIKIYIIKYICIPILNGETYKAIIQNKADFIILFDRILISLVLFFVIFTWHHR